MKAGQWQKISGFLALLTLVVLLLSYAVAWWMTKDGQLVQLVIPENADVMAVRGESGPGTLVGKAGTYLIGDPAAFLEGRGTQGERFVSQTYLEQKGIYPLQTKTVWFFHFLVALFSGLGALIFGLVWWFLNRRRVARSTSSV